VEISPARPSFFKTFIINKNRRFATISKQAQNPEGNLTINRIKLISLLLGLCDLVFVRQRKRTATKLANPRINQITFHTFRHWKATMEYHKTKDILHVIRILGHKNIKNTLIYT
jgi:integrase